MKKEKIIKDLYNLMDSFLVEGDKPRSIERLNQDRHLFVKNVLDLLDKQKQDLLEKIEKEFPTPKNLKRGEEILIRKSNLIDLLIKL